MEKDTALQTLIARLKERFPQQAHKVTVEVNIELQRGRICFFAEGADDEPEMFAMLTSIEMRDIANGLLMAADDLDVRAGL